MDFKSVELQIAVPRTSEAGRIQQDAMHRPMHHQHALEDHNIKSSDRERRRSAQVDESTHASIRDDHQHPSREDRNRQQGEDTPEQEKDRAAEHPFKGHHLDLSL
ncbi:hypothetical protein EJP77_13010 [Paenibacillus zeisoli]|uniref:Uncharacterized protein n=1 Tax=Paenibacillus zeisoli TaxID=2496267 RepID=A0A3S1B4L5_9BACL|nr:hypothetical protein [Paenibacillus zeisoli]RUT29738.1 hypothetical protein EJP77_13010 [Paenibacillus zeisoli]